MNRRCAVHVEAFEVVVALVVVVFPPDVTGDRVVVRGAVVFPPDVTGDRVVVRGVVVVVEIGPNVDVVL